MGLSGMEWGWMVKIASAMRVEKLPVENGLNKLVTNLGEIGRCV